MQRARLWRARRNAASRRNADRLPRERHCEVKRTLAHAERSQELEPLLEFEFDSFAHKSRSIQACKLHRHRRGSRKYSTGSCSSKSNWPQPRLHAPREEVRGQHLAGGADGGRELWARVQMTALRRGIAARRQNHE